MEQLLLFDLNPKWAEPTKRSHACAVFIVLVDACCVAFVRKRSGSNSSESGDRSEHLQDPRVNTDLPTRYTRGIVAPHPP